jgi:hypothetical protein
VHGSEILLGHWHGPRDAVLVDDSNSALLLPVMRCCCR